MAAIPEHNRRSLVPSRMHELGFSVRNRRFILHQAFVLDAALGSAFPLSFVLGVDLRHLLFPALLYEP